MLSSSDLNLGSGKPLKAIKDDLPPPRIPRSLFPAAFATLDVPKIPFIPDQASKTQPNLLLFGGQPGEARTDKLWPAVGGLITCFCMACG